MSVLVKDKTTGEWVQVAGGATTLYAEAPIGSIIPFGGTTAPDGFLLCQGQAVSRTTYAELFAVIGTSFGGGDGSTTFNVPDLREATTKGVGLSGKSSNHYDTDGVVLGEFVEDRIKSHTHTMNHTHTFSGTTGAMNSNASHTHTTNGFESVNVPKSGFGYAGYLNGTGTQTTNATNTDHTHNYSGTTSGASTSTTGSTGSATTEVKAVGVNYIIKATQVGVPTDFAPVDAVESGNMKAVTSNAVYDAVNVIQSGTGARNTSYVSSENFICNWYKVGKICTVNIQYTLSQLTSSSVEIITGLPKPVADIACVGEGNTNTNVSDFVIKTNGAIRTHYNGAEGQFMHGTATYITAD